MKYRLKEDHFAYNYRKYDVAGSEVSVEFKHDNVWIVKNAEGKIYPIPKDKLCILSTNEQKKK